MEQNIVDMLLIECKKILSASAPPTFATRALTPLSNTVPSAKSKGEDATAFSDVHDNQVRETEIIDFAILAQELEAQGKLEDAQETREEVERLKERFCSTYFCN
jgi:hypothetical protein